MYWQRKNKKFFSTKSKHQTTIIGVVGAKRGVGVTHFCVLLAEYIALDKGSLVAVLECNNHGDFEWLEEKFSFHQVDYYGGITKDNLNEIIEKEYAYLILDFGEQLRGKQQMLALCQKKILIGVESWWKKTAMKEKESYFLSNGFSCFYNMSKNGIPFMRVNEEPNKKMRKLFDGILNGDS